VTPGGGTDDRQRGNVGIQVSVAQSTRVLLPALAKRLRVAQPDPFTPDIVVVPSVGQRDWLLEQLGALLVPEHGGAGICTNVEFWFPADFNRRIVATGAVADDPWDPQQLGWTILGLLDSQAAIAPRFDESKRPLSLAQRIAELFDRYGVHRPELLRQWRRLMDGDALAGERLGGAYRWQMELWQVLRAQLGPSPGERFLDASEHLQPGALSARLSVFGLEQFSTAMVGLLNGLAALGDDTDIAVFGVFPAPAAVAEICGLALDLDNSTSRSRREIDVSVALTHPLVRSWGVSGAEAVALLGTLPGALTVVHSDHGPSVLARVQASIANDAAVTPVSESATAEVLARCDGSIQIHQCHGPTRQVEVLRDALLHLMNDDPTLTPRDIVVICPNLEVFAPLIGPVLAATPGGVSLPVEIIDKSSATATAVADTLDALLAAVGGRLSVSEVRGLLARGPVRRRFGITDDDLDTISGWLDDLDTRWGIDAAHRSEAPWNYPTGFDDGTWRQGLDRLAAGVLVQAPQMREAPEGVVPFDDLGGSHIDTMGRLVDVVDALDALARRCRSPHDADGWADVLAAAIGSFVAVDPDDRRQLDDATAVVAQLRANAPAAGGALLGVSEIRSWVASCLDGIHTRSRQWGDVIRVASLTRLRGVPARVVAILGFDHDAFRSGSNDGDDILAIEPRIGERDLHAEQRLGLLTTVCAATDALVITCNGYDVTNNKRIPMAIALEELADTVASVLADPATRDAAASDPTGSTPARSEADGSVVVGHGDTRPLVVSHARQAADPVNFGHDGDDPVKNAGQFAGGVWTFDPTAAAVATEVHRVGLTGPTPVTWPVLLDAPDPDAANPLTVAELIDAVRRPSDVYLRTQLRITLPGKNDEVVEDVTLWPGSLAERSLGAELVTARRSGVDIEQWLHLRSIAGGLPPGGLRDQFLAGLSASVDRLFTVDGVAHAVTDLVEVAALVSGRAVVDDIDVCGHQVVTMTYSKWHPRHRLAPWLRLAAVTLARPDVAWESVIVSLDWKSESDGKLRPAVCDRFVMVGDTPEERVASATTALAFALDMRQRALRSAIPLFERSSWSVGDGLFDPSPEDLSRDLERPTVRVLFGDDPEAAAMRTQDFIAQIDDGLAPAPDRASAYATTLVGTFCATVEVTDPANPKKPLCAKGSS
jgi:exodeoxyribonuclease V gamma subunit